MAKHRSARHEKGDTEGFSELPWAHGCLQGFGTDLSIPRWTSAGRGRRSEGRGKFNPQPIPL
jgi:hypothetical protein